MTQRLFLSVILSFFSFLTIAQNVELKKEGKNSFSFSTKEMILIKDFRLEGATYHITDDPYSFSIIALTENGEPDKQVNGSFTFLVNEQLKDVEFTNGQALAEHSLGDAEVLTVQLAQTNLVQTKSISRFGGTPALVGVLVFLLITYLFRHQLARMFRNLFGLDKDKKSRA